MQRLYVLYDGRCGLCRLAKRWASGQRAFVELVFLEAGGKEAVARFPTLNRPDGVPDELVAVSDEGAVYRDSAAWIMCLYALEDYREWAERLASPWLRPLARQAFAVVSENRSRVSRWLDLPDHEAADMLRREAAPACAITVFRKTQQGAQDLPAR